MTEQVGNINKKDWLDFIRNLKREHLTRVNLYGFSLSAYIIYLFTAGGFLLNDINKIFSSNINFFITIFFFITILNLITILFRLTGINQERKFKKPYSNLDKQSFIPALISEVIFGIIAIIPNIYSAYMLITKYTYTSSMPYIVNAIIGMLVSLSEIHLISQLYFFNKKQSKPKKNNKIKKFRAQKVIINFLIFCIFISWYALSFYSIISLFYSGLLLKYNFLIRDSIYLLSIMLILIFLPFCFPKFKIISWLDSMEKLIFMGALDDAQIKKKFIEQYYNRVELNPLAYENKILFSIHSSNK